jgi:hypothetical protein
MYSIYEKGRSLSREIDHKLWGGSPDIKREGLDKSKPILKKGMGFLFSGGSLKNMFSRFAVLFYALCPLVYAVYRLWLEGRRSGKHQEARPARGL